MALADVPALFRRWPMQGGRTWELRGRDIHDVGSGRFMGRVPERHLAYFHYELWLLEPDTACFGCMTVTLEDCPWDR